MIYHKHTLKSNYSYALWTWMTSKTSSSIHIIHCIKLEQQAEKNKECFVLLGWVWMENSQTFFWFFTYCFALEMMK